MRKYHKTPTVEIIKSDEDGNDDKDKLLAIYSCINHKGVMILTVIEAILLREELTKFIESDKTEKI